ncbi:hypothetical protein M0G74_10990 [Microbulbifer sp. CAU 1566]|uniref:hypothetical protein n=1 Tax=Microbulbifer sp. CAU 1566 TaxID=2933269 RepID=UPI002003AA3C|nr:hypothetical protein [Microbulbifer sp. CAU 1566]MCK7597795.1 hypothetical protein [Microbulbifer sp. CAU 1566]
MNVEKFVEGLHDYLSKQIQPLADRIKNLESKLESIESKGMEYRGIYQRAQHYGRGDVVTHKGSMWVHVTDGSRGYAPGDGACWQLAAKGHSK